MTQTERDIALRLSACSFLPGSSDKRFVKAMAFDAALLPDKELSTRQAARLMTMCHKYRRQMPPVLVALAARTLRTLPDDAETAEPG